MMSCSGRVMGYVESKRKCSMTEIAKGRCGKPRGDLRAKG